MCGSKADGRLLAGAAVALRAHLAARAVADRSAACGRHRDRCGTPGHLGPADRVEPRTRRQNHELCTSGPYHIVRHPIYTGIVGLAPGATLVAGFGSMLLVLPCAVAFAVWRVYVEDRMMRATF